MPPPVKIKISNFLHALLIPDKTDVTLKPYLYYIRKQGCIKTVYVTVKKILYLIKAYYYHSIYPRISKKNSETIKVSGSIYHNNMTH